MNNWLDQITLISQIPGGVDEDGFDIEPTESLKPVLCNVKSCKRTEFYQAQNVGVNALYSVEVNTLDYGREKLAELDGIRYKIYRTYEMVDKGVTELTLAEIEADDG